MFKKFITNEFEKIIEVKTAADLYRIFFRAVQIFSTIGLVYFLIFTLPLLMQLGQLEGMALSPGYFSLPLLFVLGQIVIAEFAVRSVERGQFAGIAVGIGLSLWLLFSWLILIGIFGLYCFLNADFQQKHAVVLPRPFLDLLSALRLNRVHPGKEPPVRE
jgi:hypothetical protein